MPEFKVDDGMLVAYADGQLNSQQSSAVETAMLLDHELSLKVDAFRASGDLLKSELDVAGEVAPDHISHRIREIEKNLTRENQKKINSVSSDTSKRFSGWFSWQFWSSAGGSFAAGVACAILFITPGLFDANELGLRTLINENESSRSDITAPVTDVVEKADPKELKFDFYTLLKETEILVPDGQDSGNTAEPEQNAIYVLQAGSFKNARDAENLKVELLLMNLSAERESVKSKNGDIWHRVLVGPFTDTSKMASARAKLAENNIDSLKLKRKQ